MKYFVLTLAGSAMLLSACGTYTGAGAVTGAHLGSLFGSAVGGLAGGHHGYHVGTLVGMAGGAVVGAAVGSAADKKSEIYEYNDDYYNGSYSASPARTYTPSTYRGEGYEAPGRYNSEMQIRNVRFVDANMDNVLVAGEDSKLIFEVMNTSDKTLFDVCPLVVETTGNKHVVVSPGIHVERIEPGKGIRYTAMVHADSRLKDGMVKFRISAVQGDNLVSSKISEVNVVTKRRR
ncbi:MAG: hypothetical protein IKR18_07395 [Bacteroidaceae bacterium]|nr:hypothetical protein [Bacteroidaceae bacterium]